MTCSYPDILVCYTLKTTPTSPHYYIRFVVPQCCIRISYVLLTCCCAVLKKPWIARVPSNSSCDGGGFSHIGLELDLVMDLVKASFSGFSSMLEF